MKSKNRLETWQDSHSLPARLQSQKIYRKSKILKKEKCF